MKSLLSWMWIAILSAPWLLLFDYFSKLWSIPEYRFFPFLLLALGWLVFERWDRHQEVPSFFSRILVGCSLVLLAVAVFAWSPWLALISWQLSIGAWLSSHRQKQSGASLLGLWILSFLLVRLPLNLDGRLTSFLQAKTSRLSSFVLDWLDVSHLRNGNVFDLAGGQLFVENACSGVQSLFALLFVATLVVVWLGRSAWLWPIYLIVGYFWAGALNIARVVGIAVGQEWYGVDLAHGFKHELLGYTCLVIAILLLLSSDRLLRVLFYELPSDEHTQKSNPAVSFWNWLFRDSYQGASQTIAPQISRLTGPAIVVSLLLIVGQVFARPWTTNAIAPTSEKKAAIWNPATDLFNTIPNVTLSNHSAIRGGDDITLGDNSDSWELFGKGFFARVAVSQPYNEFHEMTVCYEAVGWKLNERKIIVKDDWAYVIASFTGNAGETGMLIFSGLSRSGKIIEPIDSTLGSLAAGRWSSVFAKQEIEYNNLMIQLWAPSKDTATDAVAQSLIDIHLQTRNLVRNAIQGAE